MLCFYDSINASYLQQDWFKKVKAFLIAGYGKKRCKTSSCRCLFCNFSRETKIGAKEKQVLAERQGVDGDRHIATRQIGGDLAGHELGVGAGHIDVGVRTLQQTVDRPFPAGDLLYLIQQEVAVSLACHGHHQLVIHLFGGDVFGNVHLRVPLADDMIHRHTPPQQLLRTIISIPEMFWICNEFFLFNLKNNFIFPTFLHFNIERISLPLQQCSIGFRKQIVDFNAIPLVNTYLTDGGCHSRTIQLRQMPQS